jgi:hypothetical protein
MPPHGRNAARFQLGIDRRSSHIRGIMRTFRDGLRIRRLTIWWKRKPVAVSRHVGHEGQRGSVAVPARLPH